MSKPKVMINGKSYDIDTLSKEAKASLQSIRAVDNELARLNHMVAALKTARNSYAQYLIRSVEDKTN